MSKKKTIKATDIVIYARNGDKSTFGQNKKDLWMVKEVTRKLSPTGWDFDEVVKLKSISNPNKDTFTTDIKNVFKVVDIVSEGYDLKSIVNHVAYDTLMGFSGTPDEDVQEARRGMDYKVHSAKNKHVKWPEDGVKWSEHNITVKEINMNDKVKRTVNANVEAAKVAASVTAGKTLNSVVADKVKPQLPIMVRGYADTPIGKVVIANIADFVVKQFMPHNEKANIATNAMMDAAMVELLGSFDLEKIVSEVVSSVELPVAE